MKSFMIALKASIFSSKKDSPWLILVSAPMLLAGYGIMVAAPQVPTPWLYYYLAIFSYAIGTSIFLLALFSALRLQHGLQLQFALVLLFTSIVIVCALPIICIIKLIELLRLNSMLSYGGMYCMCFFMSLFFGISTWFGLVIAFTNLSLTSINIFTVSSLLAFIEILFINKGIAWGYVKWKKISEEDYTLIRQDLKLLTLGVIALITLFANCANTNGVDALAVKGITSALAIYIAFDRVFSKWSGHPKTAVKNV